MWDAVWIGECMVELMLGGESAAAIGYAGDTFNTAVYLARLGVGCAYATAVGQGDPFSEAILQLMAREGVATDLVTQAAGRLPGLYAIECDERSERSFFYWRGEAPARQLMDLADRVALQRALNGAKAVGLSAITLAILDDQGRARLLDMLAAASKAGAGLFLDTNYRPTLWAGPDAARAAIEEVAPLCRWISAGAGELAVMGADPEATARAWADKGAEVVLRADDRSIQVLSGKDRQSFSAGAAFAALDTTGAGDAFNAAYLAARLTGGDEGEAVAAARRLAAVVVAHRGAIIAKAAMPMVLA